MGDSQPPPSQPPKPACGNPDRPGPADVRPVNSSESDASASIDEEEESFSGSDDYCEPTRKGGSRRAASKSSMRKRRKRPEWTRHEEETLAQVHCGVGNQWSVIAGRLPGRTANEVKNIWHSTLRSKHLKARSLLRAYATALNGRWDDEVARQDAYNTALRQHDNDGDAQGSAKPQETRGAPGSPASPMQSQRPPMAQQCVTSSLPGRIADGSLPAATPAQRRAPDASRTPPPLPLQQRVSRGGPAAAPGSSADRPAARSGPHRGSTTRPQTSPSARNTANPSGLSAVPAPHVTSGGQDATPGGAGEPRGVSALTAARAPPATPMAAPVTAARRSAGAAATGAVAAEDSAMAAGMSPPAQGDITRRLEMSFNAPWGPPQQPSQRPWPQANQADYPVALPAAWPRQQQQPQAQPQAPPQHQHQPGQVIAARGELHEGLGGGAQQQHGVQQMLGFDSLDTWLGRLDTAIMLQEEDGAAPGGGGGGEPRRGADSTSSSAARAVSVAAALAAGRRHQEAGPGGEAPLLIESGPASGAWSSNSGATAPYLQSPPPDGAVAMSDPHQHQQHLPGQHPATDYPMDVSPTRGGGSRSASGPPDHTSPAPGPSGPWHPYAMHDGAMALPYGVVMGAPPAAIDPDQKPTRPPAVGWAHRPPPFGGTPRPVAGPPVGWRPQQHWQWQRPDMKGGGGVHGVHGGGGNPMGRMGMVPVNVPPPLPPHLLMAPPPPGMRPIPYHCQEQFEACMRHPFRQQDPPHPHAQQYWHQLHSRQEQHHQQQQQLLYLQQQQQQQQQRQQQQYQQQQQQYRQQQMQQEQQEQQEQQQQQEEQQQPQGEAGSGSDVITMGFGALQDPQLRWCLMDME